MDGVAPAPDADDRSRSISLNGPLHPVRIAVCIPTYRRPNLLAGALDSIAGQVLVRNPEAQVRVCVVDNDPEASARGLVKSKRQPIRWPLVYAVEPRRGVSQARNRLLELAGEVDFVAFLDDDEVAQPSWGWKTGLNPSSDFRLRKTASKSVSIVSVYHRVVSFQSSSLVRKQQTPGCVKRVPSLGATFSRQRPLTLSHFASRVV